MLERLICSLTLAALLCGCGATDSIIKTISDPYGLLEAETEFEANSRLLSCANDEQCPMNADALFWLAAFKMGSLETGRCEWTRSKAGYFIPTRVDEERGLVFDDAFFEDFERMTEDEHESAIEDAFNEFLNAPHFKGDYDDGSEAFREAYAEMKTAYHAGSYYAANELALIHIEDPELFGPENALVILEDCAESGNDLCAFNYARGTSLIASDGCGKCASYLQIAASATRDPLIKDMNSVVQYLFGGPNVQQRSPSWVIDKDSERRKRVLSELKLFFPSVFEHIEH